MLRKTILSTLILLIYGLLFYCLITSQLRLDFASFYSATLAYVHDFNPYQSLYPTYLSQPQKLPVNLNPPIFLQLLSPLVQLNFYLAAAIWFLCSLILGSIGALLGFKILSSRDFFKKNWFFLLLIYLSMYSTLMNISIGQVGGVLLFFVILGYYFYLKQRDYLAGLLWGLIIAIKLFPALLFFFVLHQKRFKLSLIMLAVSILAGLLPLFIKGADIYFIYFNMVSRVLWFGDSWNASLYGIIFRLSIPVKSLHDLLMIKSIYLFFFIILLFWYFKAMHQFQKTSHNKLTDHRAFCLTLAMMLFLSPMGWLYYFSLLIMPLYLIWQTLALHQSYKRTILWTMSLFLLNAPIGYIEAFRINSIAFKLTLYSAHFYGLVLLIYLLTCLHQPVQKDAIEKQEQEYLGILPLYLALVLGLFVILSCFTLHFLF